VLGRHLPQRTPLSPMLAVLFQLVALGVCNLVCAPESETWHSLRYVGSLFIEPMLERARWKAMLFISS
jgi:hypothetical protein